MRFAHSWFLQSVETICLCFPTVRSGSSGECLDISLTPGFCFTGCPLYSGMFQLQAPTRRNGSPGVNTCLSAHERRVYVSGLWQLEDFVLCCGLVPPNPPDSISVRRPMRSRYPAEARPLPSQAPLPDTRLWYHYTLRHYLAGSGTCITY